MTNTNRTTSSTDSKCCRPVILEVLTNIHKTWFFVFQGISSLQVQYVWKSIYRKGLLCTVLVNTDCFLTFKINESITMWIKRQCVNISCMLYTCGGMSSRSQWAFLAQASSELCSDTVLPPWSCCPGLPPALSSGSWRWTGQGSPVTSTKHTAQKQPAAWLAERT